MPKPITVHLIAVLGNQLCGTTPERLLLAVPPLTSRPEAPRNVADADALMMVLS